MAEFLIAVGIVWLSYRLTGLLTAHTKGKPKPKKSAPPKQTNAARAPTLRITYQDAEGQQTTRDVAPFVKATNERFRAYCHLRQEAREFLFERVQGGVDLQTGEILNRAGVFKRIHPNRSVPPSLK